MSLKSDGFVLLSESPSSTMAFTFAVCLFEFDGNTVIS